MPSGFNFPSLPKQETPTNSKHFIYDIQSFTLHSTWTRTINRYRDGFDIYAISMTLLMQWIIAIHSRVININRANLWRPFEYVLSGLVYLKNWSGIRHKKKEYAVYIANTAASQSRTTVLFCLMFKNNFWHTHSHYVCIWPLNPSRWY